MSPEQMNTKLSVISEVFSDAYLFLHLRELVLEWEKKSGEENSLEKRAIESVDQVFRLCALVKKEF